MEIVKALSLSFQAVIAPSANRLHYSSWIALPRSTLPFFCWAIQVSWALILVQVGPTQRIVLDRPITSIYEGTHSEGHLFFSYMDAEFESQRYGIWIVVVETR